MSVNKYRPHVWVLPEDDADRQIAVGFMQHHAVNFLAADINKPAGGWPKVLAEFEAYWIAYLRAYPHGHLVMVIDFDGQADRRQHFEDRIPEDLSARVFLVGAWYDPESLRAELNWSLEAIGERVASNCLQDQGLWAHPHLAHNTAEAARMTDVLRPILFPGK